MALKNGDFPCWEGADVASASSGSGKRMQQTLRDDGNVCQDCGFEHDGMMEVCGTGGDRLVTVCPLCHAARHAFKTGESGEGVLVLLAEDDDQASFNRRLLELFRDGRVEEAGDIVRDLPVKIDMGRYGLMELAGRLDEGKGVPSPERLLLVPVFSKVKMIKAFADKARKDLPDQFPDDTMGKYMFPDKQGELPEVSDNAGSGEGLFSRKMLLVFAVVILGGLLAWSFVANERKMVESAVLEEAVKADVAAGNEANVYEVTKVVFTDLSYDGDEITGMMKESVKFHVGRKFLMSSKIPWMPIMAGKLETECGSFTEGKVCVMSKKVRFAERSGEAGTKWVYIGS